MIRLLSVLTIVAMGLVPASFAGFKYPRFMHKETKHIVLSRNNMVFLEGPVDQDSVAKVERDLQRISLSSAPDQRIYLVLDTPGGSVDAGNDLIEFIKGLPQKVDTVTLRAASMGFIIVQALNERMIVDSGYLMSHRAKYGMEGESPGQLESRIAWVNSILNKITNMCADRMGISKSAYMDLIRDEYWATAERAIEDNAADTIVTVECDKSLAGSETIEVQTLFNGVTKVQKSFCPLIH